ncbi:MAG: DUF4139 domain-containing protein, partial [Desulfovibrionaceae bacterium]|nr:DUF4139 domain-containing protein [Desulfovibrionaceae bacterium]
KQAENVSPQLASAEDARKLCLEIVQTEDSLKSVDQKLSILPARERKWKLVTLRISEGKPAATAKVEYSYVLPGCRWQPVYTVSCDPSAEPGKDRKTWINVRLEAEITQPSGLDWPGTHLSLVLGGSGYAELPALDSWVIGENGSRPAGMPRARLMMAAAPEAASADGNAVSAMDGSGTYTVWTPPLTGLAAGMNRVTLDHADWQEQLVWTARPLNSDTSVYLCAEHQLTEREHAWPAGRASMIADDVHVGDMTFSPRAGSVFLSFGRDPRVSLEARTEPRRSGQQGLIGKKKVWEWEWTYTVRSALEREALVRVERPLPLSTYKGCEVQFTTVPQAAEDRTEKKLTWEFALPAGAEKSLKHTVRVTAPEDARIAPVAP